MTIILWLHQGHDYWHNSGWELNHLCHVLLISLNAFQADSAVLIIAGGVEEFQQEGFG